jgi:hypothetical protein
MPLDELALYRSDSGSSIRSHDADEHGKASQYDSDSNATEADSNDERSEAQKFEGQSEGQSDSDQHTPAQKSKRQRYSPITRSEDGVGPSDSESVLTDRDELFGPSRRKRGFKRPRIQWELVSSWNKAHVQPDDYQGEIARIMAKSMHDAKTEVTPKYNARAISDFRFKTVRASRLV